MRRCTSVAVGGFEPTERNQSSTVKNLSGVKRILELNHRMGTNLHRRVYCCDEPPTIACP
jgi:hypothetical protein